MADVLTAEVSDRICKHMNDDHADAVVVYAKVYGGVVDAISARMLAIDPQGMDLAVQTDGSETSVRIPFDHPLADSEDAHHTLIDLLKAARTK